MRLRFWDNRREGKRQAGEGTGRLVTHRQFLKLLLGAIGGAGAGLATATRLAEATYTPGSPDVVNTNLTVQGNLIVVSGPNGPGNVGIGTDNPQGKLDVAGEIRISGNQAIGSDGVVKQSYYAP